MGKAYDWEMEKFRVLLQFLHIFRCKKNLLIEAIKEDSSKTFSDSLRTHLVTSIGRLTKLDNLKVELLPLCLVLE